MDLLVFEETAKLLALDKQVGPVRLGGFAAVGANDQALEVRAIRMLDNPVRVYEQL